MGIVADIQGAANKINGWGWRRTFFIDALRERDTALEDAFNTQGASRWLTLANTLLINNGMSGVKWFVFAVYFCVIWLVVGECARFGRKG